MTDETKLLCVVLRDYARQYADGSTLGRAIEDTEIIMRDAADLLEAQAKQIAETEAYLAKATQERNVAIADIEDMANNHYTNHCDYCKKECSKECNCGDSCFVYKRLLR